MSDIAEVSSRDVGSWSSLVTDFELAITAQGLKAHTIANYSRDVSRFAEALSGSPRSGLSSDNQLIHSIL